jgi:quinol monooxygenase YgiN
MHTFSCQTHLAAIDTLQTMLINSVHFTFADKDVDTAREMLHELRDASVKEEGVLTFDVVQGNESPTTFALWEEYADQAAFEAHARTEHFQRLVVDGVRHIARVRDGVKGSPI